MSRAMIPAALVAAAFTFGSPEPALAATSNVFAAAAAVENVTGARVAPATGRTEVVINVSGGVRVEDFALANPHRIVVDLHGARLGLPADAYDRQTRGVLRNLRFSQYNDNVVRVVLDVDDSRAYSILETEGAVRVAIQGGETFTEWSSGQAARTQPAVVGAPQVYQDEPVFVMQQPAPAPQPAPSQFAGASRDIAFSAAPGSSAAPSNARRITVTYDQADVRDVIAAFAAFSGRTIITGREVSGLITAEVKDQPWDTALHAILTAQQLAATQDEQGIITVDSYTNILARQSSEPLVTRLVSVNYATAGSLVETVQSLLSRDCAGFTNQGAGGAAGGRGGSNSDCITRGQVVADSSTNTLVISEVPSRMAEITNYVRQLDVRTPQVAIKAKLISVNRTQTEQLGVSYDFGGNDAFFNTLAPRVDGSGSPMEGEFMVGLGGNAMAGVANANRRYQQGSALNLIFTTMLGRYSLTTFLDALSEAQLSDVQAEPSIVTLDNRTARILVGQETPIRVIDAGSGGQVGQMPRATVEFKETGIILAVTPHITNNRQILMNVEAEQSQINNIGGDLGYVFDKRQARSQVLVGDGETAVVGGLTQTTITRNRSGIPLLSQLPLIGGLFSQTDTREQKQDLLILLTPRIVDEGQR